jgi:hypothetical protein
MVECGSMLFTGLLAQDAQRESSALVLQWLLILAAMLVGMFVVVNLLKKWFRSPVDEIGSPTGFTLSDLRTLHQTGKMTDEEFELAKGKVVEAAQAAMARAAAEKNARAGRRRQSPPVQVAHKPEPEPLPPEDDFFEGTDKNGS